MAVKKDNNIDKNLEIVKTEAAKYFSIKTILFMLLIVLNNFQWYKEVIGEGIK